MVDYMGFDDGLEPHDHAPEEGDGSDIITPTVVNGRVQARSPVFDTLFSAIEWAYDNGYGHVDVPPGVYEHLQVSYPVHVHEMAPAHPWNDSPRVVVDGADRDGVLINAEGATVSNIMALTNYDSGNPYSAFTTAADHTTFINCFAFQADFKGFSTSALGIDGGADFVQFWNCGGITDNINDDEEVYVHNESENCTVDVDPQLTVLDNGVNTKVV